MKFLKTKFGIPAIFSARSIPSSTGRASWLSTATRSVGYPEVAALPAEKQRGLRAFWLDGLFASMAGGFADPYYTLYLLSLNASNAQIGLVNTLSQAAGAVMALPGAALAERTGHYKRVSLLAGLVSRLLWLVMLSAPWLLPDRGAVWMVLVAWFTLSGVGALGNAAWTALTADLVPIRIRGSYFASRNMIMHLAQLLSIPAAGVLVGAIGEPGGYQASLGLAFGFGVISLYFFRQLPEHVATSRPTHTSLRQTFRAALGMKTFVRFVAAHSILHLGVMIGGPFINVYLAQEAGFSVSVIGFATTLGVLASLVGMRALGRLHDRFGMIWTMRFGLVVPLVPISYLLVTQPWHAYVISVISALTWAGYNLGAFNLLLASTPDEQRPRFVAFYTTIVSVVGALGPIVGGGLLDAVGYGLVFGLSFGVRALGLGLLFALVREPEVDSGDSGDLLPDAA